MIPKRVKQQSYVNHMNNKFEHTCRIRWCTNLINAYKYEVTLIDPTKPVQCSNCLPVCKECLRTIEKEQINVKQHNAKVSWFQSLKLKLKHSLKINNIQ